MRYRRRRYWLWLRLQCRRRILYPKWTTRRCVPSNDRRTTPPELTPSQGTFHRQRHRSSLRGQQLSWKPIIGFTGEKKFLINFGHQPFLYDLRQHEDFMKLYTAIQTRRWPALARPMTFPPEILAMILTFLSLQLLDLQRGDQYIETIQCLQACRLSCRAWAALLRSAAFWQVRLISSVTLSAFVNTTLSSQSSQDLVRIAQVIGPASQGGHADVWCSEVPGFNSTHVR